MQSQLIRELLERRTRKFPLSALLKLYLASRDECYVEYMHGFKCWARWLAPISDSDFTATNVFYPLYTYEVQEIAKILNLHPSIIQQEFFRIYSNGNYTTRT